MKKNSQRERVKRWLEVHGSITNGDALHRMTPEIRRLSQRITELQSDGLEIKKDWLVVDGKKTREYEYTLLNRKPRIIGWDTSTGVARPIYQVPGG